MESVIRSYELHLINLIKERRLSDAIELVVKTHHPLEFQDDDGRTALILAIQNNNMDLVDLMLNEDNCTNNVLSRRERMGYTALDIAILKTDYDLIRKILKKIKYNTYVELTNEIDKYTGDIVAEELSNLALTFELSNVMNRMTVEESPLKIHKQKLEVDRSILNSGMSWLEGRVDLSCAISLAEKRGDATALELLSRPPPEPVVVKEKPKLQRILKPAQNRPRVNVKSIPIGRLSTALLIRQAEQKENRSKKIEKSRKSDGRRRRRRRKSKSPRRFK